MCKCGNYVRALIVIISLFLCSIAIATQSDSVYLYSSFRGNGQDGLHLAYSKNGLSFKALNGDKSFLRPTVGSKLMRDPSICQGPDGKFHMVWTTGWNDDGIGIAHSPDLINWSEQSYLPVMANEPNATNCWAPEIFYDDQTEKYMICWSTTIRGRFPETFKPEGHHNHRIYYVTTKDFENYSDTALFYNPGFNCIDAFIVKDNDGYVMFLKNETLVPNAEKNICLAHSTNATGPYSPPSKPISPDGLWVEGPSAIKIKDRWILYYDAYQEGHMGALSSRDLKNWTDITEKISFPSGTRHGTVFKVDRNILDGLKTFYEQRLNSSVE